MLAAAASATPSSDPTHWGGAENIVNNDYLDREKNESCDCYSVALKVCTVVGLIIAALGACALIGIYGVDAGSITHIFQKAALFTNDAAFFIGATPMTLAWTVTAMGASVFIVGFFGMWINCCNPPHQQKNDPQNELPDSHLDQEKRVRKILQEKIERARHELEMSEHSAPSADGEPSLDLSRSDYEASPALSALAPSRDAARSAADSSHLSAFRSQSVLAHRAPPSAQPVSHASISISADHPARRALAFYRPQQPQQPQQLDLSSNHGQVIVTVPPDSRLTFSLETGGPNHPR